MVQDIFLRPLRMFLRKTAGWASGTAGIIGYLDEVRTDLVRGWALDDLGARRCLTLEINGRYHSDFCPDLPRSDLVQYGLNANIGFEIPLSLHIGDTVAVKDKAGRHLAGSPAVVGREKSLRAPASLLFGIEKSHRILEIGPSYNPKVPKREGWNSYSLDHMTKEELIRKYEGHNQPVHRIEDVDFIWQGGAIEDAVPRDLWGTFDACIASHVIEHIPNPIGFYRSIDRLLVPDGVLALAVPDKRWMFDFFKQLSTTAQFLDADCQNRTRHTRATAYENLALNASVHGQIVWDSQADLGSIDFMENHNPKNAFAIYGEIDDTETSPYVDFHGWTYTPSSFELIVMELNLIEKIPFRISALTGPFGCEFYVQLRRGRVTDEDMRSRRSYLYKKMILELGEQADAIKRSGFRL